MNARSRIADVPTGPIVYSRRGACPALSAPMRTGDGLLVRLHTIAGGLSPKTLIGLCESALRHGNGIVEITARGSFQLRGLTEASAADLAGDVDALAIDVRTGVPIDLSALAGLDPQEIADPRPLADAIRSGIEAKGLAARLGPKVSVVIDGRGHSGLDAVAGDVRLTAQAAGLWLVAIGGDAASARLVGVCNEADAAQATLTLLTAIAEEGIEARARDLPTGFAAVFRGQGFQPLQSFAPPSVLPDISPAGGEIMPAAMTIENVSRRSTTTKSLISPSRPEFTPNATVSRAENISGLTATAARLISPLAGEMSGRTEGGATERGRSALSAGVPIPLIDNRHALPLALPFGSVDAPTLIAFAQAAIAENVTDLRLAPGRTIIALCPSSDAANSLRMIAAELGFITSPSDPRSHIAACAGAPACASGYIATRTIARDVADLLTKTAYETGLPIDPALIIHISGCAKGCAHPAPAALTLVGGEMGAGLVVAGTARDTPPAHTSADKAASGLARLAALIAADRLAGEAYDVALARLGPDRAATAFCWDR